MDESFALPQVAPFLGLVEDVLAQIIRKLVASDVYALISIGNPQTTAIVQRQWREIKLKNANPIFPFRAFLLPQLRALRVKSTASGYVFVNLQSSLAMLRRNSLTSLSLHFRQAWELLVASMGSESLSSRFPSLLKLDLQGLHTENAKLHRLAQLPPTLTSLTFCAYNLAVAADPMDISVVSTLPRTLTELKLQWPSITTDHWKGSYSELWPPQLRLLSLYTLPSYAVLSHLPDKLEEMDIYAHHGTSYDWKVSTMPHGLSSIQLRSAAPVRIIVDSAWPENMKILPPHVPVCPLNSMPSSLAEFPVGVSDFQYTPETFAQFPHLKSAYLHTPQHAISLPSKLVEISISGSFRLPPLPPTITTFTSSFLHLEDVSILPKGVKSLSLSFERSYGPYLTSEHFALLPELLVKICCDTSCFKDRRTIMDFKGLRRLHRLRSLQLDDVPRPFFSASSNFLVDCLPSSLEDLCVFQPSRRSQEDEPSSSKLPSYLWLHKLCLAAATPNLRSLHVQGRFSDEDPLGPLLAALPKKCKSLRLWGIAQTFEPTALSNLPRGIEAIDIQFSSDASGSLSNEHFEGLPNRLIRLEAQLPRGSIITEELAQKLPPYMTKVVIAVDDEDEFVTVMSTEMFTSFTDSRPHLQPLEWDHALSHP